jgi:hypothetical protein
MIAQHANQLSYNDGHQTFLKACFSENISPSKNIAHRADIKIISKIRLPFVFSARIIRIF